MRSVSAAGLAFALLASVPARAGIYTDDLSRCLVAKTTIADRNGFIRWMFAAMSASPVVRDLTRVTEAERENQNHIVAALMSRLVLQDCRAQSVSAIRYEGMTAFQESFRTLGQVAASGLMTDPNVAQQLGRLGHYLDDEQFRALGKDAGVPVPATPQTPSKPKG